MYFSQTFLTLLIVGALVGIGIAIIALLTLLIKDIKSRKLW